MPPAPESPRRARSEPPSIAAWSPRPTDVVIAPFAKCGATWLRQILHTLRTRGDTDFDDISRVVPWIVTAQVLGLDLEAPQEAGPRGIKSPLPFHRLPAGARAIEPRRHDPSVLLTTCEPMSADPAGAIRRVAASCDIALDDDLLAPTLERSSLAWMLRHSSKFSDPMIHAAAERTCGLPDQIGTGRVRRGQVGGHVDDLSPALSAEVDRRWRDTVTPAPGFDTYEELAAAFAREPGTAPSPPGPAAHGQADARVSPRPA